MNKRDPIAVKIEQRSGIIDVYRCMLMFGVCLLHAITQGGYVIRGLDNLLSPCVIGFFIISGWFGMRLKPSKVLRLLGIVFYAVVVNDLVAYCSWNEHGGALRGYWFVWSYLVVMLFSPLVQKCSEAVGRNVRDGLIIVIPIFICVFVWSYATKIPVISNFVPSDGGFGAFSSLTFVGVYACVRIMKTIGVFDKLTRRQLFVMCFCSAVLVYVGFYHHNSLFAFIFALSSFLLFINLRLPPWCLKLAHIIAPSMFAIYLFHSTNLGFKLIGIVEKYFVDAFGISIPSTHMITAVMIFTLGLIIDIPRRIFCYYNRNRLLTVYDIIDKNWK